MSIAVMNDVWLGYPGGGSELLTLLALADYGNDDGLSIHPSIGALAHKVRVSESQVRRVLRTLEAQKMVMVVGNHAGGAPGSTRKYRLNVRLLRTLADKARTELEAKKSAKKRADEHPDFEDDTPSADATPSVNATPRMDARDGSHGCARRVAPMRETGCMDATLTTIEPLTEPPTNHQGSPALCSAVAAVDSGAAVDAADAVELLPEIKPVKPRATKAAAEETEIQAACRATWAAYCQAYAARYGVAPIRNAKVNAAIKSLVQRIGYDESPAVAAFYVASVNDAFIVRQMHDVGYLLKSAEGYRTQWATGRAVTATAAKQADQTAANYSAVDEAKAFVRARRAARQAGEEVL